MGIISPVHKLCTTSQGDAVFMNDIVYVAGSGECTVKYSKKDLAVVFEDKQGNEMLYYEVIEDLERVILHAN